MTDMKKPAQRRAIPSNSSVAAHRHSIIEAALAEALIERGVTVPALRADGEIHRFDAPDKKRGNLSGWYVVPTHEVGVFGFWHTGEQQTVTLRGEYDPIAAEQARQAAERARRERQQQRVQDQARAASRARETWLQAGFALAEHPYLLAKGVQPHGLKAQGQTLLVPLFFAGKLVNLQRIAADGAKRFMKGGRIKGAACPVGRIAGASTVYICEGWATAATIHETTGHPVVAAMNAGNLEPVARRLRASLPDAEIIIAADNDRHTAGNPGYAAAHKAAEAIRAGLTWPRFPCTDCKCSDFNDLAKCKEAQ
ncbi:toprim domain-containing protein [Halomonas sp. GXIMD04776]|uniref:toprim domain-containing protein n=1 Tax=Halomonas sp. GXIMD04776 TaxID=3415605 RepID=UPI003CA0495D